MFVAISSNYVFGLRSNFDYVILKWNSVFIDAVIHQNLIQQNSAMINVVTSSAEINRGFLKSNFLHHSRT